MKVSDVAMIIGRLFPYPREWELLVELDREDDGITLRVGRGCGC